MRSGARLIADLADAVPPSSLILGENDRQPFERDWRGLVQNSAEVVLLPGSTDEVSRMVTICARHGVAIVPQGGNTGLVAGAVPKPDCRQAIMNLRRMRKVRAVSRTDATMIAEAGVTLAEAKEAAAAADLLLPVSLPAEGTCQIGGNVATNAGGIQTLAYGSMRQQVLGLEVVLADGRIWDGLRTLRKENAGIDLKQLFIGSEGILGIVTAASLRLLPSPRSNTTFLAAVPSVGSAHDLFRDVFDRFGLELTSCEYFTGFGMELVTKEMGLSDPFRTIRPAYVLVELSFLEADREPLNQLEPMLARRLQEGSVLDVLVAQSEAQRASLWRLREELPESELRSGGAVKHDIAVPLSALPPAAEDIGARLAELYPGARINIFGHLGDGNLHVNVLPPPGEDLDAFRRRAPDITEVVESIAVGYGGTFSAEHGVGQMRVDSLVRFRDPVELELMRAIKLGLDPHWIMNPGKVLRQEEG